MVTPSREERVAEVLARAAQAADPRSGLAALEQADAELRVFGSWHLARGSLLARERRWDDASAALREAAARDPDIPEVTASLGAALVERARRQGPSHPVDPADLAEGVAALRHAFMRSPKLPGTGTSLGLALQLLGQPEEALTVLDAELQRFPDHLPAHYNRASVLNGLGRLSDCAAALERLLALDPGYAPARESLHNLRARMPAP